MQPTLEVRWFLKGTPPATVQHWFQSECPGELLTTKPETREDLYAYGDLKNCLNKFKKFASNLTYDRINLKLREGSLELKLKTEQFGIQTFTAPEDRSIWSGRVEQWCKFNLQQLEDAALDLSDLNWIRVYKTRSQKTHEGVESELTLVKVEDSAWWSIAFEMTTESNNVRANFFRKVVEQAATTYYEPKLLAEDCYSYAHWLDKFTLGQIDYKN